MDFVVATVMFLLERLVFHIILYLSTNFGWLCIFLDVEIKIEASQRETLEHVESNFFFDGISNF